MKRVLFRAELKEKTTLSLFSSARLFFPLTAYQTPVNKSVLTDPLTY